VCADPGVRTPIGMSKNLTTKVDGRVPKFWGYNPHRAEYKVLDPSKCCIETPPTPPPSQKLHSAGQGLKSIGNAGAAFPGRQTLGRKEGALQ
jgi:hypothetical protein